MVVGTAVRMPPPPAKPSLLLSPPRARLPLIVLLLIVALPASDVDAAAKGVTGGRCAGTANGPVAGDRQPVTVRPPSRLWRPPPWAPLLVLSKATFRDRSSPDRVRLLPSFRMPPPWSAGGAVGDRQAADGHVLAGRDLEDPAGVVAADGELIGARARRWSR